MGDGPTIPTNDEQRRAKTIDILNNYINRQRSLLERIKADISNLEALNDKTVKDPEDVLRRILDNDHGADGDNEPPHVEELGTLVRDVRKEETSILNGFDWDLYQRHDYHPFRNLADTARRAHPSTVFPPPQMLPPSTPSMSKHPPSPSPGLCDCPLRNFVREQRALILDPVFALAKEYLASFPPDTPPPIIEPPRNNKDKTRNGQRKRQESNPSTVRPRGPGGVFIKRSVAEAQSKVPLSSGALSGLKGNVENTGRGKRKRRPSSRLVDSASNQSLSRSPSVVTTSAPVPKLTIRIPARSIKASRQSSGTSETAGHPSASPSSSVRSPSHVDESAMDVTDDDRDVKEEEEGDRSSLYQSRSQSQARSPTPRSSYYRPHVYNPELGEENVSESFKTPFSNGITSVPDVQVKNEEFTEHINLPPPPPEVPKIILPKRGETFKQAWSVEEQHTLERLLEQYPEGTRNRWATISREMDGRRTPRQVASRVQKYYAKMKRFGVNIAGQ